MVFTLSETCNAQVPSLLERLTSSTRGSTLHEVIQAVSSQLTSSFNDALGFSSESNVSLDNDTSDDGFEDYFEIDYDESFLDTEKNRSDDIFQDAHPCLYEKEELQRLRKDLKTA